MKKYTSERELCADFSTWATKQGWTVYPETAGFDLVLVDQNQRQIGIEAKLRLNAKVIIQASTRYQDQGPDYRAVLVPKQNDLTELCKLLGISVLHPSHNAFAPALPPIESSWWHDREWFENLPSRRLVLPEYVPDCAAGVKSPLQLTTWKIKMMRLSIIMDRGPVSNPVFKALGLNKYNLTRSGFIKPTKEGMVKAAFPDLREQHPINYSEVERDIEKWIPK